MMALIKKHIRDVKDFPKPGIVFKDITPLLQHPEAFLHAIDAFEERYRDLKLDVVAGIESRGFIFGAPLAMRLGASFIPVRKKGKLPYKTVETSYDLEYGSATIEMHTDAVRPGQRVLVVDDLLATGGTAGAACAADRAAGRHDRGVRVRGRAGVPRRPRPDQTRARLLARAVRVMKS